HTFFNMTRIVQTPALVLILYESPNSPYRTVFMDGRDLPKDPNPTWFGYSVGRWDGDTLVVTTAGFNDKAWLDSAGHPQTESLRITGDAGPERAKSLLWTGRSLSNQRSQRERPRKGNGRRIEADLVVAGLIVERAGKRQGVLATE